MKDSARRCEGWCVSEKFPFSLIVQTERTVKLRRDVLTLLVVLHEYGVVWKVAFNCRRATTFGRCVAHLKSEPHRRW